MENNRIENGAATRAEFEQLLNLVRHGKPTEETVRRVKAALAEFAHLDKTALLRTNIPVRITAPWQMQDEEIGWRSADLNGR